MYEGKINHHQSYAEMPRWAKEEGQANWSDEPAGKERLLTFLAWGYICVYYFETGDIGFAEPVRPKQSCSWTWPQAEIGFAREAYRCFPESSILWTFLIECIKL